MSWRDGPRDEFPRPRNEFQNAVHTPEGWLDFTKKGKPIPGTPFIALKTPLQNSYKFQDITLRWPPMEVMAAIPKLGVIINLCFTDKYYNTQDFRKNGVRCEKLGCKGREIPKRSLREKFASVVDDFRHKHPGKLIGVHCTHGVNRTGFMICWYLVEVMGWSPERAVEEFETARGHAIQRENYTSFIYNMAADVQDY